MYVCDYTNNLVRRIDAVTGAVTNLGTNANPAFSEPAGIAVDSTGQVYFADAGNSLIRRMNQQQALSQT